VEFKGRTCLDIDELEVYDYDRIGLVGANRLALGTGHLFNRPLYAGTY
jgi:ATPase subunit of ABC transporter with duplicated ATPase domains